ncbi:adenylyl cyclase-associated protein 1 [Protopterus annectens]|uniref:adenylyl cyclase-associated protein 1 n=1 Tax=Protopterus annectens TaxID=7888 RepID=UPI001CF9EE4B|nr:adenylyl cyclase-associated protein 1 [Protopterus annectens]
MADLHTLVERLEKVVERLEVVSQSGFSGGDGGGACEASAAYVEAFDALISGPVAEYLRLSKEIGGDVEKHASMVGAALQSERNILVLASKSQQPPQDQLSAVLKPVSDKIQQVQDFREQNRTSKLFNHLSAVSESISALGWITMSPKPGPFVKEMTDAATFYTNRVLKDYKDTDKKHVEWVKAYINIWTNLQAYIKEYHTTGLSWSKTGPKASAAAIHSAPSGGGPPPPPGLPPPPAPADHAAEGDVGSRSRLFAQLNQGEAITKGLKHVSDKEKTHKNPDLRSQGPVRSGPKPFTSPKPAPAAAPQKPSAQKQPPLLVLEGKKWRVENYENNSNVVVSNTELKQVVYIFKCVNSTVQVKGKINSITLDQCKKVGLVFEDAVGIVEVINCKDVKVQVINKVPTISINKTDGCHVYLSKDSLNCEIISAKASEMNVLVPAAGGEFTEFPVPEQYKTTWDGHKLVTTVTEIAG